MQCRYLFERINFFREVSVQYVGSTYSKSSTKRSTATASEVSTSAQISTWVAFHTNHILRRWQRMFTKPCISAKPHLIFQFSRLWLLAEVRAAFGLLSRRHFSEQPWLSVKRGPPSQGNGKLLVYFLRFSRIIRRSMQFAVQELNPASFEPENLCV